MRLFPILPLFIFASAFVFFNKQIESSAIDLGEINPKNKAAHLSRLLQESSYFAVRASGDLEIPSAATSAFARTNYYRKWNDLLDLEWSKEMHQLCKESAYTMAAIGLATTKGARERFRRLPFKVTGGTELAIILRNSPEPGHDAVERWFDLPSSKAHIISNKHTRMGAATVETTDKRSYTCESIVTVAGGETQTGAASSTSTQNPPTTESVGLAALHAINAALSADTQNPSATEKRDVGLAAFHAINAFATANGLPVVEWNDELSKAALGQATYMAANRDLDLAGAAKRLEDLSFAPRISGHSEMIAATTNTKDPGAAFVKLWLRSSAQYRHRIQDSNTVAVAAVEGADGKVYICQMAVRITK